MAGQAGMRGPHSPLRRRAGGARTPAAPPGVPLGPDFPGGPGTPLGTLVGTAWPPAGGNNAAPRLALLTSLARPTFSLMKDVEVLLALGPREVTDRGCLLFHLGCLPSPWAYLSLFHLFRWLWLDVPPLHLSTHPLVCLPAVSEVTASDSHVSPRAVYLHWQWWRQKAWWQWRCEPQRYQPVAPTSWVSSRWCHQYREFWGRTRTEGGYEGKGWVKEQHYHRLCLRAKPQADLRFTLKMWNHQKKPLKILAKSAQEVK